MARAILALPTIFECHHAWLEPFWHSSYEIGRARMARAILALKFGQWHYLHARMARAILALPTIFECHNGLSHSGTQVCNWPCQNGLNHSYSQVMQLAVSELLEPFWHSSYATGRARMARTILTLKSCNWPCQNGSSHSGTQIMQLAVPECLTLKSCNWPCQNGLSHSGTQVM